MMSVEICGSCRPIRNGKRQSSLQVREVLAFPSLLVPSVRAAVNMAVDDPLLQSEDSDTPAEKWQTGLAIRKDFER